MAGAINGNEGEVCMTFSNRDLIALTMSVTVNILNITKRRTVRPMIKIPRHVTI
jgi:hypothetical protein